MAVIEERRRETPRLAKGVVARGRTVVIPDPIRKTHAGYDLEGNAIKRAVLHHYGPGQEVELPTDEIKELRASGYLIDPDAKPPEIGNGPNFSENGHAQRQA